MPQFRLYIATPESILLDEDVQAAIFPGTDGFFEILANHAPLIAQVKIGEVVITDLNQIKRKIAITGGLLDFHNNKAMLLCYFVP